jgi:hypothetical protein
MQTNALDALPVIVAGVAGAASFAEIRMSRPYKELKRKDQSSPRVRKLENGLKLLSLGTITVALALLAIRIILS